MAGKPRTSIWRLVIFALLPLAIGWLAMEGLALAYFLIGPSSRAPRPQLLYQPHPYSIYTLAPNRTDESRRRSHNSHGLRGLDFSAQKPPATVRILCLGGSTTYSDGATTDGHTYPAHLERFLREHYTRAPFSIEVINAGLPGYTSLESLILFQTRLLDFSPDVAILHNCLNDAWMAVNFRTFASDYSHGRHTLGPLAPHKWEYSPLLSLLFARATTPFNPYAPDRAVDLIGLIHERWGETPPPDALSRGEPAQRCADALGRNALSFVAVARGNGVIPVLSTMTCYDDRGLYAEVMTACNDRIRAIAASPPYGALVTLVDLARKMPWNPRAFYDICHLRDRPEGLEQKGKIFADALIREGIVERAGRSPTVNAER